ncbi:MAG: RagB/SusD family nutrient uptake outer membrane protein [Tannerella sp.]|jgi:hypothetical protein|nr:RagB/SusD family nutrient uptake outer membrane protein [Tannerella sp.]
MKQILVIFSILILAGCADFLDRPNPENAAYDFFQKGDTEAEYVINAVYATVQYDAFYSRFLPMLWMVRTEEGCLSPNGSKMEENFMELSNYNSSATEKYTTNLWQNIYIGIVRANFAIEQVPGMSNVNANLKKRILGESYFLRAFFHLHLVMNYGEAVPIKEKVSSGLSDFEQAPAEEGVLWEFIFSDLKQSQSILSELDYANTNNSYQRGRISVGAATAFLGQAYLFYAQMKNRPEYYQRAADEFGKVISQQVGRYGLVHNYRDNFLADNEYNEESIFEAGYNFIGTDVWSVDGGNGAEGAWFAKNATMNSACSKEAPMWWNLAPSYTLLRQYEEDDYRKLYNFWFDGGAYYIDKEGAHVYNPAEGQPSMAFMPNPYPKGEEKDYIGFRKQGFDYNYQQLQENIPATVTSSRYSGMTDINYRIMRYADVLLMYAECQIHGNASGGAKSAADCIAEIRHRANNQLDSLTEDAFQYQYGNPALPYFHRPGTLKDAWERTSDPSVQLQHERLMEHAGEGKRYYDVIRWYKAGLLKDIDPDSPTFFQSDRFSHIQTVQRGV